MLESSLSIVRFSFLFITPIPFSSVFTPLFSDNSRPDVQRQESPIIGLESFNNWVKSVLVTRFAHPVLQKSSVSGYGQGRRGGGRGKVLDMGCGKGGDITKWSKARIKELLCVGAFRFLLTPYDCEGSQ
jgi:hypothetical protein